MTDARPESCDEGCGRPATHRIDNAKGEEVALACGEDVWRYMRYAIPLRRPDRWGDNAEPALVGPDEFAGILPGQEALSKVPSVHVLKAVLRSALAGQVQLTVLDNAAGMFKPRLAGVPCTRDNFAQVLWELGIERDGALNAWDRLQRIDRESVR